MKFPYKKLSPLLRWWCIFLPLWLVGVILFSPQGPIRFSNSVLEYFRFLLLGVMPVVLTLAIGAKTKGRLRTILFVCMMPVAVLSILVTPLVALWCSGMLYGRDISEHLRTVQVGKHRIEVYRLNVSGALGGFDMELRREWVLVPGLKLVDVIAILPDQPEVDIKTMDGNTFTYVVKDFHHRRPDAVRTYHFK